MWCMGTAEPRPVMLLARALGAFAIVAAILLSTLMPPLTPIDYFMTGVLATMAGLVAVFAAVAKNLSFRTFRRRAEPPPADISPSSDPDSRS